MAVKLLPPEFVSDPDRLRRFALEARATGRLSHPHIVSIFDAGLDGTQPYLVTELLDGWHFMTYAIAAKYAQIGNREASLLSLRRVRDVRGAGLMLANTAPEFDPYRSDPEFREILGPAFSKR